MKTNQGVTEIVTLHPTFTIGPTLTKYKTSNIEAFRKLISGEIPAVPQLQLLSVDVRDVAQAHINALLSDLPLSGERIALMHKPYQFIEQMNIIRDHFYCLGLTRIPTKEVGKFALQAISLIDSQVRLVITIVGIQVQLDVTKSKEMLGMQYERDLDQSLIEMVQSMVEFQIVKPDEGNCIILLKIKYYKIKWKIY